MGDVMWMVRAGFSDRADWPIDGGDTMVSSVPPAILMLLSSERSEDRERVSAWCRDMGEVSAQMVGTHLHHADVWITNVRSLIEEKSTHPYHPECVACLAAKDQLLSAYDAEPQVMAIVVGYWSPHP